MQPARRRRCVVASVTLGSHLADEAAQQPGRHSACAARTSGARSAVRYGDRPQPAKADHVEDPYCHKPAILPARIRLSQSCPQVSTPVPRLGTVQLPRLARFGTLQRASLSTTAAHQRSAPYQQRPR
jgi:hypothetical protein